MFNSRILDLKWRGAEYFVQNDTNCILPSDSDRRESCRTRVAHFWRQIKSLQTQNASYFSLFTIQCILGIINAFPANMHLTSGQLSFACPLNSNIRHNGRMPRRKRVVFRERNVSLKGQIMFKDKHSSIYCKSSGNCFVYYLSNVSPNTRHIQPRDSFRPIVCEWKYLMDYNGWQCTKA